MEMVKCYGIHTHTLDSHQILTPSCQSCFTPHGI